MGSNAVSQQPNRGPGVVGRVVALYHDVVAEMRKVTWPERKQVQEATIAIIIFVLLIGLVIFLLDLMLGGLLVRLIPSLFS